MLISCKKKKKKKAEKIHLIKLLSYDKKLRGYHNVVSKPCINSQNAL